MQAEVPFEHAALEADLAALAAEIRVQRERPEMQSVEEQELIKEAIKSLPDVPPASVPPDAGGTGALPAYAESAPPEAKLEIEYLLDLALRDGLQKAFAESRKSPYFVQDAFHDALAGRLYPELQKRGIVK